MQRFDYQRPATLAEACAALRADPEARLLAGGMSLLPTMKLGLATPSCLIDLSRVPDLNGIYADGETLVIGAMACHAEVASAPLVRARLPALAALAAGIGDVQVRYRGTLGGALANNDPAADYPAAALALEATVVTDRRELPAASFFTDMFETALAADEIVTAVRFPCPRRAAYLKLPHPASRYAIAGVFVADTAAGPRVAVTGAGPMVFRAHAIEAALAVDMVPAALADITIDADELNDDPYASATYRAYQVGVLARRAVTALYGETGL
ncbi:MAG: FAD binding domain-containing protein [Gammaproteobacteria bacterium]